MTECPSTDALTTIADALAWDVDAGLRHLASCSKCAVELDALQTTHVAYEEQQVVAGDVVADITTALSNAARVERARQQQKQSIGNIIEAILAGATALAVASGGGMAITNPGAVAIFAVVASGLFGYRVLTSSHSMDVRNSSPSIQ